MLNSVNMNRNVVKSEHATIKIPELDLEIPPMTQKGTVNTIEGFLVKTIEGLSDLQEDRRKYDPQTAAKIDDFIQKIQEFVDGRRYPFTVIMEDPSGNSFIQNPNAPNKDNYMKTEFFPRTTEDYVTMGYNEDASREQSEIDKQKFNEEKPNTIATQDIHKAIKKVKERKGQTKEEQEAMLQKFGAYANREREDPEITAGNIDFSKPID